MRTYSAEIEAAIAAGRVMPREFLEIWARNRSTGAFHQERLWSNVRDIVAEVIDPDTGLPVSHTWTGAHGLVAVSAVPRVANMDRILRTYDARLAPVRLWRGYQNLRSRRMVGPAESRFIGFVDKVSDPSGPEGAEVAVTLECVGHAQEMTRSSSETRSHESQQRRHPGDDFFKDAASVPDWPQFWGQKTGPIDTATPRPPPPRVTEL